MGIPGKVCVGVKPVWLWVVCICLYVIVIIKSPHIKGLVTFETIDTYEDG